MIITCPSCNKKFKIEDALIPSIGRNLQCGSCNYNWFYKIEDKTVEPLNLEENIDKKINLLDLILLSKLENSKSEIRRLIKGNAIKINDNTISDEKFIIDHDLFKENYLKLSIGKKRHIKVELN